MADSRSRMYEIFCSRGLCKISKEYNLYTRIGVFPLDCFGILLIKVYPRPRPKFFCFDQFKILIGSKAFFQH